MIRNYTRSQAWQDTRPRAVTVMSRELRLLVVLPGSAAGEPDTDRDNDKLEQKFTPRALHRQAVDSLHLLGRNDLWGMVVGWQACVGLEKGRRRGRNGLVVGTYAGARASHTYAYARTRLTASHASHASHPHAAHPHAAHASHASHPRPRCALPRTTFPPCQGRAPRQQRQGQSHHRGPRKCAAGWATAARRAVWAAAAPD